MMRRNTPFILPSIVLAQTPFSIENLGSTIGLGTADLKSTAINAINWVLGILMLISLLMLMVGALDWVISGSSEVVKIRAKRIMLGALIGEVVTLLAWAIVSFVAGTAANVTR